MTSHASMNRIYRLVFNAALGIWVAVAENAKGRGKGGRAASALLAVLAILSPTAHADYTGAVLRGGVGSVAQVGSITQITQASQRMAMDFLTLSTTRVQGIDVGQPNAQAVALLRITGTSPSEFLGSFRADGQVFISNPNGILFGAGAQVNVGGLVATTLGMNPTDFMNGSNTFAGNGSRASVVNQGSMTAAQGGYLALLAPEVRNEGIMTASLGTALLAAGNKITLTLDNGSLLGYSIDQGAINALADNKQLIKADGGQVLLGAKALDALTTAAVNNTGVIEAHTIQNIAGRIMLIGDMNTGTVNIGGTLDASAPDGGNGGFIETSAAHFKLVPSAKVIALAAHGKAGTWLIDPTSVTIAGGTGSATNTIYESTIEAATANVLIQATDTIITSGTFGNADVRLPSGLDLTIQTTGTGGGTGIDLTSSAHGAALTFKTSGGGKINMSTGNAAQSLKSSNLDVSGSGNITLNSLGPIDLTGVTVKTAGGAIALTATGTSLADGVKISSATVDAGSGDLTITGSATTGGAGVSINSATLSGKNINVTGTATGVAGISLSNSSLNATGNLTLNNAAAITGNFTLAAGMATGNTLTLNGVAVANAATDNLTLQGDTFVSQSGSYSANILNIKTVNGIGSSTTALLTSANALALQNTVGGGIYVTNSKDVTIAANSTNGDVVINFTTGLTGATGATGGLGATGGTGGTGNMGSNLTVGTVAGLVGIKTVQAGGVTLSAGQGGTGGMGGTGGSGTRPGGNGGNGGTGGGIIFNAAITSQSGVTLNAGAAGFGGNIGNNGGGPPPVIPFPPSIPGAVGAQGSLTGTAIDITAGTDLRLNSAIAATSGSINLRAGMAAGNTLTLGGLGVANAATDNITLQGNTLVGLPLALAANTLSITTANGIGSNALALQTSANALALQNTVGGGIYVTNSKDATVAASSTNGDVVLKFSDGVAGATGATDTGISVNGSGGTGGTGATGSNLTVGTVAGLVGIKTVQAGNITLSAGRGGNGGGGGDALSTSLGTSGSGGNGGNGGNIIFNVALTGVAGVTLNAGLGGVGGPTTGRQGQGNGSGVPPPPPSCGGSGQPLCPLMQVGAPGTQGSLTGTGIDITAGTDLRLNSAIAATSGSVNLAAGTGINNGASGALLITGANAVTLANSTSGLVSVDAGAAPVTVLAAGIKSSSTQLVTTGDITLQGSINATGAGDAIRLAGRNFTNNASATALTVANGGRYLVWSQTPVNNSFGGLMSGNAALWGTAYNPASPTAAGNGNQFIFAAAQPTGVGIVKADNKTKTYGDVVTPAAFTYTAFAGDSGASYGNAFTDVGSGVVTLAGAPAFASTGALATATRTAGNGGGASYDITVDLTGVTAAGFTLQGAKGLLTVNARSLNLSGSRSYDGSTNIAGSALVAGNSVNGDGAALAVSGAGTVASKNVGTGKAVNTAGLSLAGAAAANYTLAGGTAVADITQANLTVTAQAVTKTYDGTSTAAGNGVVGTLAGAGAGESISTAATQAFLDKNAGAANKTVRASGLTVKDAGNADVTSNYAISYADNTTSTITQKALTVSGITASNKIYDQTTAATVSAAGAAYSGLISGDGVTVSSTGVFTDKNAATGKTINLTSSYTGADAGNYAITNQASTTANITQKALTVSGITVANKVYDQGTAATVSTAGATYGGLIVGDVLTVSTTGTFTDKNAANGKTVTLTSGYTGADAGNYAITNQASTTANITQKALTVSGITVANKVYDQGTAATVSTAGATYGGLIVGDVLTVSTTGAFTDKNAANGKTVTLTSGYTGADAGNYAITNQASTTANITQRALTVTATPENKVYDGNTVATVSYADNRVAGDALTFTSTANFADRNAANNIAVNVSTVTPGGLDASNYSIGTINVAGTANITRKALTVAANDATHQGGTPYSGGNGVVYNGFVAGEGVAVLAGTVGYSGSSQGASNGGLYNITPGGQTASNYALSFVNGVLTVKSADATTAALGGTALVPAYNAVKTSLKLDTLLSATSDQNTIFGKLLADIEAAADLDPNRIGLITIAPQ